MFRTILCRPCIRSSQQFFRQSTISSRPLTTSPLKSTKNSLFLTTTTATILGSFATIYLYTTLQSHQSQSPIHLESNNNPNNEVEITPPNALQSSQVSLSRSKPGIWLIGSNLYDLVNPHAEDSSPPVYRTFRFLEDFDGKVLRDLSISERMAAAVDSKGDLYQWGSRGDNSGSEGVKKTVEGRDLVKVVTTENEVVVLDSKGRVGVVANGEDGKGKIVQVELPKEVKGQRIKSLVAGLNHVVALTNRNKVLTLPLNTGGNQYGQCGLSHTNELSTTTTFNLVPTLASENVDEIAAGDYHSVVKTSSGKILSFGNNMFGQLGHGVTGFSIQTAVSQPSELNASGALSPPATPKESTTEEENAKPVFVSQEPGQIVSIAAGGNVTYFTVHRPNTPSYELYALGNGVHGQLGNQTYNHVQCNPVKVKEISGLTEYQDSSKSMTAIPIRNVSVGAIHTAVVLDTARADKDVTFGRDTWCFGNNKFGNMGLGESGKKGNISIPVMPHVIPYTGDEAAANGGRLQLAPEGKVKTKEGEFWVEQAFVCGNGVSAVYSKIAPPRSKWLWFGLW